MRACKTPDGKRMYSDETIQALCRWATPASLKVYARINRSDYANILDMVRSIELDQMQTATLWQDCPWIDDDHRFEFLDNMVDHVNQAVPED